MLGGVVGLLSRPDVWVGGLALAAFLTISWALRGAPIGQAAIEERDATAPSPRKRDLIVAAAALGVVFVLCGAYVALAFGVPWSMPVFGLGFGLIFWTIQASRPHRHASPILRRVLRFSETALTASLLGGVLVILNVAAFRYGDRAIDVTREQVHSLESLTISQLDSLKVPVRFTAFYYGRLPQARKQVDRVSQLLDLFKAENPQKVSIAYINFDSNPVEAEELMNRVPDVAVSSGGVVIEYGEGDETRRVVVRNSEMFGAATAGPNAGRVETSFKGEEALTSALIRLREGKKTRIAMTTGHGEAPIDQLDARRHGAGMLKARLTDIGAEVVEVDLSRQEIPEGTALLIIDGPRSAFPPEEIKKLKAYMDQNGRILLMLSGRDTTGLEDFLKGYNVEIGNALVVEPPSRLAAPSTTVLARIPDSAHHPIVRPLVNQSVMVPGATPLTMRTVANSGPTGPPNPAVGAEPILLTSSQAWGETSADPSKLEFDPAKDIPGPIVVGIAVSDATGPGGSPNEEAPRLVVFSSADIASNRFVSIVGYETNLDLVVNAVNWLRGRPDLEGIAPKTRAVARLDPDPNVQAKLVLIPTLMAVSIIIGLGVATYMARRM